MTIRFTRKTILTSDPLHHLLLLFLPSPACFSLISMLHVSECQNDASQRPKSKITREEIQKNLGSRPGIEPRTTPKARLHNPTLRGHATTAPTKRLCHRSPTVKNWN
ncbi:hypothetical protein I312_103631 [Cryptococcus bacillisporus CA1280]|uniref:uncharacterized protein n=1 Tax=Cryptococcus bacillisporus CA1280 TaxID=1296109 RepID=UPI0033661D92